ncbi:hypothetical protein [Nostoc sp. C117]|uniref:hypothetical protein n=1 Tax=Nostoc sp. C117 TaxID=3349875 RepID=UPI00370D8B78
MTENPSTVNDHPECLYTLDAHQLILQQRYQVALKKAALKAFVRPVFCRKGRYEAQELA